MTPGPVIVCYIAELQTLAPGALPILLRNVRGEDGHVYEEAWFPREERWEKSWDQWEAQLGKNYNDFEEISEQQALAIQEARRRQIAQLDRDNT